VVARCCRAAAGEGESAVLACGESSWLRRDLSRAASVSSLVGVFALSIVSTLIL
jgi:hypothetical protein